MWYRFSNNENYSKSNLKNEKIFPLLLVYIRPSFEKSKELLMSNLDDICLLKNFHKFTIDNSCYEVINVCGPDSLFHSFLCIFRDMPQILKDIEEDNKLMVLLNSCLKNDMDTAYRCRIDILETIFKPKQIGSNLCIDCESNTYNIIKAIFTPTFPSFVLECSCGFQIKNAFIDLNYDYLFENGISNLQNAFHKPQRTCDQCKHKMTNIKLNDIIFIDTQPTGDNTIISPLSAFPTRIIIEKKQFRLRSIIDLKDHHYTAYCLRNDNTFYNYNDLRETVSMSDRSTRILAHTLIYVLNNDKL